MADSRKPKVLLYKTLAMAAIVVISYSALWWGCLVSFTRQDSYLSAALDKVRILEDAPSPRMILVGGSNLAFGIDSARLRQTFGLPVVNMGLHGGVGLKFMLDQGAPYLRKGDLVVIVPEYQHFISDKFYGGEPLIEVAAVTKDWSALLGMPVLTLANAALNGNTIFDHLFALALTNLGIPQARNPNTATQLRYARSGFNKDGDEIAHLALPNKKFAETMTLTTDVNQAALQYLQDFIEAKSDLGVTTFVVYPCLERSYYLSNKKAITIIADAVNKKGIYALSTPEDFVYDDDLFFDSIYHMNAKGRDLRTKKMIDFLSPHLQNRSDAALK